MFAKFMNSKIGKSYSALITYPNMARLIKGTIATGLGVGLVRYQVKANRDKANRDKANRYIEKGYDSYSIAYNSRRYDYDDYDYEVFDEKLQKKGFAIGGLGGVVAVGAVYLALMLSPVLAIIPIIGFSTLVGGHKIGGHKIPTPGCGCGRGEYCLNGPSSTASPSEIQEKIQYDIDDVVYNGIYKDDKCKNYYRRKVMLCKNSVKQNL